MAQVPNYNPVPQVSPQATPTPKIHVETPVAAFGGATAEAVSSLGATLGHVGNELFDRAQAMQQLKNETDAKDQDIKFMMSAGEIHAKYNALQGTERVEAFPKYSQDLQDLYKQHRDQLGNPMAQKMFDASAVSVIKQSIFNGAGAAATAQKEAAFSATKSSWDLKNKQSYDSGQSDFSPSAIAQIEQDAITLASTMPGGATSEKVELLKKQAISDRASHQVMGLALRGSDPSAASKLLDEYEKRHLILDKEAEALRGKINSLAETSSTKNIALNVLAANRTINPDTGLPEYSKTILEMRDEVVKRATQQFPNDPKMASAAQVVFNHEYSSYEGAKRKDVQDFENKLVDYRAKGVMEVNNLPPEISGKMSERQLKEYPDKALKWKQDALRPSQKAAKDYVQGMQIDRKKEFLEMNIADFPGLSNQDKLHFIKEQQKVDAKDDPRVGAAFSKIVNARGETLKQLRIIGDNKDEVTNLQFRGALHSAIQAWQETNKKPPGDKDIMEQIYPSLIMEVTDPTKFRWFGMNRSTEMFQAPVEAVGGDKEKAKIAAEADAQRSLTDQEVRAKVLLQRFKQIYGDSKAKAKDQGRAPTPVNPPGAR